MIDLTQFHALFFEEAAEHLASMETLLLDIDVEAPDDDDLNAIFRAAHSVKGASAIFGFSDIAEVTHILESQLDLLRNHQCALTTAMVDLFLRAGDVLKLQVNAHRRGETLDAAETDELMVELQALNGSSGSAAAATSCDKVERFRISLRSADVAALSREQGSALLAELAALGELPGLDPATTWPLPASFSLRTAMGRAAIVDVLAFVLDSERVEISPEEDGYGLFEPMTEAAAEDPGYGFFEDIPPPVAAATPIGDGEGYGFFEPLPEAVAPASTAAQTAPPSPAAGAAPRPKRQREHERSAEPVSESSIRVSVDKVDQLINLVGELVITQAMLAQSGIPLDPVVHERLHAGLAQLERNTRDLQESVMSIRMMPISFVFSRFPRMVRDLAAKLDKEVELVTIGEGTELDRGLIEKIVDPLTHLVRNSIDHGIETPAVREAAGKDRSGVLTLRATHQGGTILIEVEDNGAGLNRERILAKARERELDVNDAMSDADVWQLIFAPGFSTADAVTDVSGRGVGMDVVKRNIDAMGGRVDIATDPGYGTRISIRLPLTLAILDGMSVGVGGESYILPLAYVIESLRPRPEDIRSLAGRGQVVQVRGEHLPLIPLHEVFGIEPRTRDPADAICVIVDADGVHAALLVDELIGQQQVVIKNLETNYRKVPGIAGATIMGDGRVALILDLAGVVRMSQNEAVGTKEQR